MRVCCYQKIEDLVVTSEMVRNAVHFLVEKKTDPKAAYGLLRLIFLNKISLFSFPRAILVRFQVEYEQTILRFFKSLSICETQVAESLPPSAFCFTQPILRSISEGGKVFTSQIPYQLLPYVVEISCLSFNDSENSFYKFLTVLKQGVRGYFNKLAEINFTELL